MQRITRIFITLVRDFGGVIVFWLVMWRFGLKPAIAATVVFVIVDGLRRLFWRVRTPRIYIFATALTLIFGAIDLYVRSPFMIKYEGVITNAIAAAFFAAGAFGAKPMIQEFAEQSRGAPFPPERTELRTFFVAFTLLWAFYLAVMAMVTLWLVETLPLKEALAARSITGLASFGVMMLISLRGRQIFDLLQHMGLFRPAGRAVPTVRAPDASYS